MLHFPIAEKNFLIIIFSRLLTLDMDADRKFVLRQLHNGALFPYLPLVEQPRTELEILFFEGI